MKLRLLAAALVVAFMGAFIFAPMSVEAAPKTKTGLPVTGTIPGGTFTGTISNLKTSVVNGQLFISGVLNGTTSVVDPVTGITTVTQIVNQAFTTALFPSSGAACDILFLDLGPIFLDVLGLQVNLSRIVLDINAVPGAGNLLGNLLCAITGLLDRGGPLATLSSLLNNLFRTVGLA
jgi:hypothetical protein